MMRKRGARGRRLNSNLISVTGVDTDLLRVFFPAALGTAVALEALVALDSEESLETFEVSLVTVASVAEVEVVFDDFFPIVMYVKCDLKYQNINFCIFWLEIVNFEKFLRNPISELHRIF
jgi:hypothetical protein